LTGRWSLAADIEQPTLRSVVAVTIMCSEPGRERSKEPLSRAPGQCPHRICLLPGRKGGFSARDLW
jgi:hypothetical protein